MQTVCRRLHIFGKIKVLFLATVSWCDQLPDSSPWDLENAIALVSTPSSFLSV